MSDWPRRWPRCCGCRSRRRGDFFDDLGADSMVMAQFCARLRKRADLPKVSIKDVYRHSTIRSLAAAFAAPPPPRPLTARTASALPAPPPCRPPGQAALLPLWAAAAAGLPAPLRRRAAPSAASAGSSQPDLLDTYVRSVIFGSGAFARCASCRSWPSGRSSVGGSRGRSRSGAWPTSGSGSSRRSSGRTRWSGSPVPRSTCSTCGRSARRSGGVSRSSRRPCPCAPTSSRSGRGRSSARTRRSPATARTTA